MRRRLYHPLWTHIPALVMLAGMIYAVIRTLPFPAEAPVHFGPSGLPDRIGSPWSVVAVSIGLSILYMGTSILIDELWARSEQRKTFNWMSLFDEITVGLLGGMLIRYLAMVQARAATLGSVAVTVIIVAVLVAAGIVLELLRPYTPHEQVAEEDANTLQEDVARRVRSGQPVVYWDIQNPPYVSVLVAVVAIAMLIGGYESWGTTPVSSIIQFLIVPILVLLFYGGQRVIVTRDRLTLRMGILGLSLLRINTADIASAEVRTFSPLRDFGGYGIRTNGKMWAFYWRGNRGVEITTAKGKRYLLGSDHPDRLAAVIQAVMGI